MAAPGSLAADAASSARTRAEGALLAGRSTAVAGTEAAAMVDHQRSAPAVRSSPSAFGSPPDEAEAGVETAAGPTLASAPVGLETRAGAASSAAGPGSAAGADVAARAIAEASGPQQLMSGRRGKRGSASASSEPQVEVPDPARKVQRRARAIWEYDPPWLYLPHLPSRWESEEGGRHASTRARSPTMDTGSAGSDVVKRRRVVRATGDARPSATSTGIATQPEGGGVPAGASAERQEEDTRPALTSYDDPEGGLWDDGGWSPGGDRDEVAFEQPPSDGDGEEVPGGLTEAETAGAHTAGAATGGHPRRRRAGRGEGSGRRYASVEADPIDARDGMGHSLFITGSVVWCGLCGRYAARRLGAALKRQCPGRADGAASTQLVRLRAGRHPLTGKALLH